MQPSEILIKAKAVITNPKNWTQSTLARDANDREVVVSDPKACKFCSAGALHKAGSGGMNHQQNVAVRRFLSSYALRKGLSITTFNDTSSHSEVLAMFDHAITEALNYEKKWSR